MVCDICGNTHQSGLSTEYVLTRKVSRSSGTPQFHIEEYAIIETVTVSVCKECYTKVTGEVFNFFNEGQVSIQNQKKEKGVIAAFKRWAVKSNLDDRKLFAEEKINDKARNIAAQKLGKNHLQEVAQALSPAPRGILDWSPEYYIGTMDGWNKLKKQG
jgi:hypothetical protein